MPSLFSSVISNGKDAGYGGTGKRASYAMMSWNTSNGVGGFFLYDEDFRPVVMNGFPGTYTQNFPSPAIYLGSGDNNMSYNSLWSSTGFSTTSGVPSSNSGYYLSGTNVVGEFGNASVDIYSDGTFSRCNRNGTDGWPEKFYLNLCAIDSDHSNKRNVYVLRNGEIRCVDRLYGGWAYPQVNTSAYTVSSLNGSMRGSAAYHAGRKEMVILSYASAGGNFNVITFQNLDLNTYPDPAVAFARPEVVRVNSTVSLATNWNTNNSESYYNLKPVITDNGTIFVTVMFTSNAFRLYQFTRSGTSPVTATNPSSQSLTTSYGIEQGEPYYGQRRITSRDGTTVAQFCVYYYYGSGITCYMIDKRGNTYTPYQYSDSSYGTQIVPYKDSDWAFYYAGNYYSSNWSGGYILNTYRRASAGGFVAAGGTQYFPGAPGPNTTNYPGLTAVTDYDLLMPNLYGPK
jgi:hypothetical protein